MTTRKATGVAIPMIAAVLKGKKPHDDEEREESEDTDTMVPEEFRAHIAEAFPDMDDTRIEALYRAIECCQYGDDD